ncbi:Sodium:sulfate symporter transmembrane region-domain-containing protein [Syncephalis pseudoplumigaleata]|uniref:Sodium:sulfate symporter transmembrane region-domain-containing protein n=1 Tax=Syncephalis pseudoplumigaleata TaxID=1712513 RepID=A0A4P9Z2E6_9FUNG|nr:Sodium:sulfate symporter transmembrane region-domain-containing protein [Syncephalis pseudoplumigaleata]|eukprot:RKP26142.1 Sodium:sulfate symporter transmembrane region-domain-containing protein [Syncephalis pseudoplumigaleata]
MSASTAKEPRTEEDRLMADESRNVIFYTGSPTDAPHGSNAAAAAPSSDDREYEESDAGSGSDPSDAGSDVASIVIDQDEASRAVAEVHRLSETGPDCLRYRISGGENWLAPNEYAGRRSQPVSWASQQNLSRVVSRVSLASGYSAPSNQPSEMERSTDEHAGHAAVVKSRIARLVMLWPAIIVCIVLWHLPPGDGLSHASMRLLGVFAGVIVALLSTDFEIAFLIALSMTVLVMTRSVTCKTQDGKHIPCDQCDMHAESSSAKCEGFEGAFSTVISGYSSEVNWLVFCAFHLGQAIQVTGLGQRVAMLLVRLFGRSLLGLGYAVSFAGTYSCTYARATFARPPMHLASTHARMHTCPWLIIPPPACVELCLAPFIPSNAARGGGVIQPVVMSLARTLNSTSTKNRRPGAFLILCGAHLNLISASLFLTGAAPNPIVRDKANAVFGVDFTFAQWLKGAAVPGLLAALLVPAMLYLIIRPNASSKRRRSRNRSGGRGRRCDRVRGFLFARCRRGSQQFDEEKEAEAVPQSPPSPPVPSDREKCDDGDDDDDGNLDPVLAAAREPMPSTSLREWMLMAILLMCLALWIAQSYTGIGAALVTFLALVLVLLTGILEWEDVLRNAKAWDSFFWLGGFLVLANQFTALGLSGWFGRFVAGLLGSLNPLAACVTLALLYFLSMFCFSSITAHAVALAGPFLAAGQALNCPPHVLIALLSYFSALGGCLTNYSSGALVLYFSHGYIPQRQWFGIGAMIAVLYFAIYFGPGLLWWKIIGWF